MANFWLFHNISKSIWVCYYKDFCCFIFFQQKIFHDAREKYPNICHILVYFTSLFWEGQRRKIIHFWMTEKWMTEIGLLHYKRTTKELQLKGERGKDIKKTTCFQFFLYVLRLHNIDCTMSLQPICTDWAGQNRKKK